MQLEDDVIARNGYYEDMMAFTKQEATRQWLYLEFSQLGFIGASVSLGTPECCFGVLETAGHMIKSSPRGFQPAFLWK